MRNKQLNVGMINVCSLLPKVEAISQLITTFKLDILCINETWLTEEVHTSACKVNGYNFLRRDYRGRCSGVGLYIRDSLNCRVVPSPNKIEQLCVTVDLNNRKMMVITVYRNHDVKHDIFCSELENSVSSALLVCDQVLVLGDMNIDLFKYDNHMTLYYNNFLNEVGLHQSINQPTRHGALLDHILTTDETIILQSSVEDVHFSDHDLIFCTLNIHKPKAASHFVTYRDYSLFDRDTFLECLASSDLDIIYRVPNVDDKIEVLTNTIQALFDTFAPLRTKRVSRPPQPWITDNIKKMMSLRDNAKIKYRKSRARGDWEYYKVLRNLVTTSVKKEKRAYMEHTLKLTDPKKLYNTLDRLNIRPLKKNSIPPDLSDVNALNNHFVNSIPTPDASTDFITYYKDLECFNRFDFSPVDTQAVSEALDSLKSNASGLDGITVDMLRLCSPHILNYLTNIINSCIIDKYFPSSWKCTLVVPLAKVEEPTDFKQIRPISLLPVISKIFEKIINAQLVQYLNSYSILPSIQSGFRSNYSCLTALTKVTDDILESYDRGKITALILLDYSRAFDTVRHDILLKILEIIGLGEDSISLLSSYLSDRTQRVRLGDQISTPLKLETGVLQGSILSPTMFAVYTHFFPNILEHCNIHMYADDIQLYYSFSKCDIDSAMSHINHDLNNLSDMSKAHNLYLNPGKSKILLFGSPANVEVAKQDIILSIDNIAIPIVDEAKNLGVVMDNTFRFRKHVSLCLQRGYGSLKMLYPHRSYLSRPVKVALCSSLVLSRLQHCCQLYSACLDGEYAYKVQKLQNSCLRYIYGVRKYEHISHFLKPTNWLNMNNRFKMYRLCFYHSVMTKKEPRYLYNKIRYRTDVHNINIRRKDAISIPRHNMEMYKRSFSYSICTEYNDVPSELKLLHMKSFRSKIFKTLMANS